MKYRDELKLAEGRLSLPPSFHREAYDTAAEASDLIFIHLGLSRIQTPSLIEKLKVVLEGPKHAVDEKPDGSSHKPRNTAFELVIAAHFALAGFTVDFDSEADVVVSDEKSAFYVECKRPSGTDIAGTINDIHHQLQRRYQNHQLEKAARGLGVLCVTKRILPNSETLLVNTAQEGHDAAMDVLKRAHDDTKKMWYKNLHHQTMAGIIYLSMPIAITGRSGLIVSRQFSGRYVSRTRKTDIAAQDPDRVYFSQIINRLNQGALAAFTSDRPGQDPPVPRKDEGNSQA
ncbi:MAG: hypothetical protein NTU47_02320 [Ignavibacteriales bacterium]|nr:hypothetical protein [Ignavibacteriales bacterium]